MYVYLVGTGTCIDIGNTLNHQGIRRGANEPLPILMKIATLSTKPNFVKLM